MSIHTNTLPPIFISTHSQLAAQTLRAALPAYPVHFIGTGWAAWRTLPDTRCGLLMVDAAPRHDLLRLGQRLRLYRPACRVIYLAAQLDPLRLHVAQTCQAVSIIHLPDLTLATLPFILGRVLHGDIYYSASVGHLHATQPDLLARLGALSLAGTLVLVQMVEGIRPAHIARNLSASIASVYQQQARLRAHFGVSTSEALVALFKGEVMLGENE